MPNDYFKFKRFLVRQAVSPMKVGTDGVLLGAWCSVENSKRILDVGTGTGIIALMTAQRSSALIDAVEIDDLAFQEAKSNASESEYNSRIRVIHSDFLDYANACEVKYDTIVSNPPYFENSLHPVEKGRTLARHNVSLNLTMLINGSIKLLSRDGFLSLILPKEKEAQARLIAGNLGFNVVRSLDVKGKVSGGIKRVLIEWSSNQQTPEIKQELSIYNENREYSPEYIELTREFYLNL